MLFTLVMIGCAPVEPNVHLDFLGATPLEVDTIANDTNGDGSITDYVAEEISVALRLIADPNANPEMTPPSVDITEYTLNYTLLNASAAGAEMPGYTNGVTIHLESGESGEFLIRAVSFVQKDWAHTQFDGAPMNVKASLKLVGTYTDPAGTVPLDNLEGDFDIIFADFAEP